MRKTSSSHVSLKILTHIFGSDQVLFHTTWHLSWVVSYTAEVEVECYSNSNNIEFQYCNTWPTKQKINKNWNCYRRYLTEKKKRLLKISSCASNIVCHKRPSNCAGVVEITTIKKLVKPKNKEYLLEDLQICLLNEAVADLLIAEAKLSCHIHGQSRGLKARPISRARLYNFPQLA